MQSICRQIAHHNCTSKREVQKVFFVWASRDIAMMDNMPIGLDLSQHNSRHNLNLDFPKLSNSDFETPFFKSSCTNRNTAVSISSNRSNFTVTTIDIYEKHGFSDRAGGNEIEAQISGGAANVLGKFLILLSSNFTASPEDSKKCDEGKKGDHTSCSSACMINERTTDEDNLSLGSFETVDTRCNPVVQALRAEVIDVSFHVSHDGDRQDHHGVAGTPLLHSR
jgi:hypothetical protein